MQEHNDTSKIKRKKEARTFLTNFKEYTDQKEKDGLTLKYEGRKPRPEYYHLSLKLEAIEESIVVELGKKGLRTIKGLYEQEMRRRIIEAQEHQ
ncbi:MAG: hypothetical protein JXA50_03105 [Deltaproteobacteria bacterium]|nr:hypothetical protein [Deltaproteobacteria bacterium]